MPASRSLSPRKLRFSRVTSLAKEPRRSPPSTKIRERRGPQFFSRLRRFSLSKATSIVVNANTFSWFLTRGRSRFRANQAACTMVALCQFREACFEEFWPYENGMRAVVQRASRARVIVDGRVTGEIGAGLMVLLAVGREDTAATAKSMAEKIVNLRIFNDAEGKMNLSLLDVHGALLAVSQFTLYGDARGGRRPSFIQAAPPEQGKALYEEFARAVSELGVRVEKGVFQAHMAVELVNDGPVTILLDSDKSF